MTRLQTSSDVTVYRTAAWIALLAVFTYLRSLTNDFVTLDDNQYIFDNPYLANFIGNYLQWAFTTLRTGNWHPLTWISHGLDHACWGLNPAGHHATSVLLHGLNTFLVFVLTYRLVADGRERSGTNSVAAGSPVSRFAHATAAVVATLFAVHPVHVESVAWIAERKDVLSAFFYLLSLLSYRLYLTADSSGAAEHRFVLSRAKIYLLTLFFFCCALMSKPMAVTLPLVLLLLDWYPYRRLERGTTVAVLIGEKLPFFACGVAVSVVTMFAQYKSGSITTTEVIPLSTRVLVAAHALFAYCGKLILPVALSPSYPYPSDVRFFSLQFGFFAFLALVLTAGSTFLRKKQPLLLAVWAFYLVSLLPVLGLIQAGRQPMADRYAYLPSVGPFLLAGVGIAHLLSSIRRRARLACVALCGAGLLLLVVLTERQIGVWQNGVTLWTEVIETDERYAASYVNRPAILSQHEATAYEGRGNTFTAMGRYPEAIADYDTALALDRNAATTFNNRGFVYELLGNFNKALADYSAAIAIDPLYSKAYANRCNVLQQLGRMHEAEQDCRRGMELLGQEH